MGVIPRPVRAGAVAAMGLAITAFTGTLASAGAATPAPGASLGYVALANKGAIDKKVVAKAIKDLGVDPEKAHPVIF